MRNLARRLLNNAGFDIVRRAYSNTDVADHLRNVIDHYAIDCVLDVGANVGQYGRMLRGIGFSGHIVSFEPVHSVFTALAAAAQDDPRWSVHEVALGSTSETRAINVFTDSVFSSFHAASDYSKGVWDALKDAHAEDVKVVRLDDIFDTIRIDTGASRFLLKLDTQGFDSEAFRGARGALAHIPAMQSELSLIPVYDNAVPPYDALREFHDAGYAISGMYPINREPSLAVIEYDCVLVARG